MEKYYKITSLYDTIPLMNSSNYQDRFVAEYYQTYIRCERLRSLLLKHNVAKADVKLRSSISLLEDQLYCMNEYLDCLKKRAMLEGIDLGELSWKYIKT